MVLVLNGTHGPLQWRDLQTGGMVLPSGASLDDPVEFIVQMDRECGSRVTPICRTEE